MRVLLAETIGFCGGVKRAMRIALDAAARHGGLRTEGPLVHNRAVVELLARHGVSDHPENALHPLLIRAHGVPPDWRRARMEDNVDLVDATCIHVAGNQRRAEDAARAGETVLIAGDANHAEVKAVAGCAGPSCRVVGSVADIERLAAEVDGPVFLLAQTTFDIALFEDMARALLRRPDARVADTICRATHTRQREARDLARRVDAVVVVGGADSANTRRLAETARAEGRPAFVVETAAELIEEDFLGFTIVGVTSGASTPDWMTHEAADRLRHMGGGIS
ncbi:MAG: 4-hydroxy-3-methylbut-2-enyl diphosphate reductase [Planctomycetota bacterium]|jgi:4-hydroxy-3-methylbut-2-enyl diphosphate reductase|nr:4-hydroxy-3-methylbut-2-enyl diphosphate reductase [Planctomycetota bacterium]